MHLRSRRPWLTASSDSHAPARVHDHRPQQGTVAAWLLTAVRYRAIDAARANHKHASRRVSHELFAERSPVDDPLEIVVARDEAQRLQASLAMLPDAQAEVITLAYYGQLTHTEIPLTSVLPRARSKAGCASGL